MPVRVLVVDDEPNILAAMQPLLASRGYAVAVAMTGQAALAAIEHAVPDVVVLDLVLPDMDGVEVCRLVREEHGMPIIVLSARGAEADKVRALDAGADDYVTKPFGPEELLARLRAALRRVEPAGAAPARLVRGDLSIDREGHRVTRNGQDIRLTPKEMELLLVLAGRPGRVLTQRALLKAVWGPYAVDQPQQLRVLIGALRKKIEPDPANPHYIVTEPWVGYRFVAPPEPD
jgi:two-component system, OmpR family, KDP operon response regulator KdpE